MSFAAKMKGALGLKPDKPKADKKRLAAVRQLPCVICDEWHMPQNSPTEAHHCIHGRHSMGKRSADQFTVPLCEGHHSGDFDTSKIALHRHPDLWKRLYGEDVDWLEWTDERIEQL